MEFRHRAKYIKFIAIAQVIAIVLVVFGHSLHEYPDGEHGRTLLVYRLVYTFHMQVFVFVSGFLMAYTTRGVYNAGNALSSMCSFIVNKVRRLLVPFLFLSLVTFVPRALLSSYADESVALDMESLWRGLVYPESMIVPYYWFIHTSLTLLVLCYIARLVMHTLRMPVLIADLLLLAVSVLCGTDVSFLSLNITMTYSAYFVLGILYFDCMELIDRYLPWDSLVFFVAITALWLLSFKIFENTGYMWLCSILGILMVISLSRIIELRNIKILDHLSGANYIIFLLSWYFNVASQQILSKFIDAPWWLFSVISVVAGIYVPWIFYEFLKKYHAKPLCRGVAFFLGQKIT